MPQALIFGITGYAGSALARQLVRQGWAVRGIGRSESAADDLESLGIEVEIADVGEPEELDGLGRPDDHVFYLVGSISGHPEWTERVGLDGVVNAEAALADAGIASFVLVQTLAVYGQGSDETISEDTPTQPNSQLGQISLQAEGHLRDAVRRRGFPARFVRAGTIYGPGRRTVDALRRKRLRMLGGGGNLSSRIHVDDLATVLAAVAERGRTGEVYLAVDDEPVSMAEYFDHLADRAHVPAPGSTPRWLARAMISGFGLTSKLTKGHAPLGHNLYALVTGKYACSNRKIRNELGVELAYPTYVEGVESLLADEDEDA
jgi:nucleoside-diphosphate-sugar epimerase